MSRWPVRTADFISEHRVPKEYYNNFWKDLRKDVGQERFNKSFKGLRKQFRNLFKKFPNVGDFNERGRLAYQTLQHELQDRVIDVRALGETVEHEDIELDDLIEPEDIVDNTFEEVNLDAVPEEGLPLESVTDLGPAGGTFEATESTALLGGGASATASGGGGALTTAVAGGITGSLLLTTAGLAASRAKGAVVPGTNNIGPGNEIQPGTSLADEDAAEHDHLYQKLIDQEIPISGLKDVDKYTIDKFGDHFAENNLDVPAILGYVGLQAKQAVEDKTGPLYPSGKSLLWAKLDLSGILMRRIGPINVVIGMI